MSSDFLKTVADCSERRFLRTVQRLVADKVPCGIFFAPAVPTNARQIVDMFKNSGLNLNCICVLTEEHKKFFQPAEDETLVALEEFSNLPDKPKYIFSVGNSFAHMFMDFFKHYGAKMFSVFSPVLNFNAAETQYNLYMKHLPELYDVHEMFADDESKKVFRASITGKMTNLLTDFLYSTEPQYFLNGFLPVDGDIAIDGGAYDGENAVDFSRQGAKVYAFEMNADNYQKCLAPAEKFGFTVENLGLSNMENDEFYGGSGTSSRKVSNQTGGVIGHFVDLDTYVERKNLPRVDYIKLDIEGSELEALRGASKTIVRWKPKMAICIYHKPEDLWTLPTYIKSLRPDYEFQFRHHQIDGKNNMQSNTLQIKLNSFGLSFKIPSEFEMVLYCK